jgi:hypothetical protein
MFRRNRPLRKSGQQGLTGRLTQAYLDSEVKSDEAIHKKLQRANDLYEKGLFKQAAISYENLAKGAIRFRHPRRSAQLYMRAFDAWGQDQQIDSALSAARAALHIIVKHRPAIALNTARYIAETLVANGYRDEAFAFAEEISSNLKINNQIFSRNDIIAVAANADETILKQSKLPNTCPQCGGRLPRAYGDEEVECDYCGSVIRAE